MLANQLSPTQGTIQARDKNNFLQNTGSQTIHKNNFTIYIDIVECVQNTNRRHMSFCCCCNETFIMSMSAHDVMLNNH